jgi:hypothetical protein
VLPVHRPLTRYLLVFHSGTSEPIDRALSLVARLKSEAASPLSDDYPQQPIPNELDAHIIELITVFLGATPSVPSLIKGSLNA